jgi:hypothetical protein
MRKCLRKDMEQALREKYHLHCLKIYKACETDEGFLSFRPERAEIISLPNYRGFEGAVAAHMIQRRRMSITRGVIEAQTDLRKKMSLKDVETELASTSRSLTEQARRVALVLGAVDAVVAETCNKFEI